MGVINKPNPKIELELLNQDNPIFDFVEVAVRRNGEYTDTLSGSPASVAEHIQKMLFNWLTY